MNKKQKEKYLKIGIPVGVVLLLIIISLAVLMSSKTRVAFLNIEEGDVQVDQGSGWTSAEDGMKLGLDDKVRTLDGSAVVVLYESVLVQLDPETEISIEELSRKNSRIRQESGSTWNKFMAIAGIQNFEVETPTTVATVRGTSFWVDMDSVGVESGQVDVRFGQDEFKVQAGHKALREGKEVLPFDEQDRARAILRKQIIIKHLKQLRQEEIEKHKTTYNLAKKLKGWTDADVQRYMDRLDRGEFDPDQLRKRTILPAKSVDKFAKISEEIIEQKRVLEQLKTRHPDTVNEQEGTPTRTRTMEIEGIEGEVTGQEHDIREETQAYDGINSPGSGAVSDDGNHGDGQADLEIQSDMMKNIDSTEDGYIDNAR